MPTEIEAKLSVEDLASIRGKLDELGAERIGKVLETNIILDTPGNELRRRGCGLRVRSCATLDGESRTPATLTFKDRVQPGKFKLREELEVEVTDADTAVDILRKLGYTTMLHYEKKRESWQLRDCRIELDEPAGLGRYVEIEGPDEQAVEEARNLLELSAAPHVGQSYVALVMAHCRERGIDPPIIKFA